MPKVSIIIPVYNMEKYLRQCLDSVVNQTLQDIEIICIDDCSTDNSLLILKEYAEKDIRFHIIEQKENCGQGRARNIAIDTAKGEYIAFVDPDDWIEPEMCEKMYNQAKLLSSEIVICEYKKHFVHTGDTKIYSFLEELDSLSKAHSVVWENNIKIDKEQVLKTVLVSPCYSVNKIYKTDLIKRYNIKNSETRCYVDVLFVVKCLLNAEKISYTNDIFYNYRIHSESVLRKISDKRKPVLNIIEQLFNYLQNEQTIWKDFSMNFKYFVITNASLVCQDLSYSKRKQFCNSVKKYLDEDEQQILIKKLKLDKKYILRDIFSIKNTRDCYKQVTLFGKTLKIMRRSKNIKKKYNIAVVGCGVIGGALIKWVQENTDHNILKIDPPKGLNDDISKADVVFVSIHIPTEDDGSQDLTILEGIIENCPNVPIYIRTTLLPGTCDRLSKKFNKDVNFMPEFLTERTAVEDFYRQPMVFSNHENMLKEIFIGKEYVVMNSLEAEVSKYAHNVFGALKVTYFNGINELCSNLNIDYQKVRKGVLLSGYINAPHISVPGPDGKFGYGGKCFPKDVNAFIGCLNDTKISELMKLVPVVNQVYRKKNIFK